jgi:hypothetical protein
MATPVNIVFTGICLFLTKAVPPRVIIGKTASKKNCFNTPDFAIPAHYPYLTYSQSQRTSGKTVFKGVADDEAVLLSGLVTIAGNIVESSLTFPGGNTTLANVIKTTEIAPNYTPLATVDENDIAKIDPKIVAARIDLPYGVIATPTASESYWHFFPTKGKSVRMQVAQAVLLTLNVSDDTVNITEQPFVAGAQTEVVTLKSTGGRPINIRIGNSSEADITPVILQAKPSVGPDFDFELHWNIFDKNGDPDCPPASFNEGSFVNGGFVTLGGGNCPPTQLS